jgi:hypothetical protein
MFKQRCHYSFVALAMAGLFLTAGSGPVWAQSQDDSAPSVAEAARRAREQKKTAAKPVRTVTNEDLPAAPESGATRATTPKNSGPSGDSSAKPGDSAAPTNNSTQEPAAPVSDENAKQKEAENAAALERTKRELAQAQHELDVMQRKAALDSDAYYSKPDFANDKEGKANLDAEAQQINDKKQAVDALQARVAELQALVGEPAAPEPEKNPSNPPNR